MIKEITPSTARTQSIELAVAELSKRESITMTDVREFMDTLVSTKIKTGKKAKYTDPNGEEHEYEVKAPISQFYTYRRDENEILVRAQIGVSKQRVQPRPELVGDVKISDGLKELKKVAWNIRADSVYDFTKLILEFIEYTRTGKMEQNNIYLKSAVEGNGKSFLMHKFLDSVKAVGIPTGSGSWPKGEHSDLRPFMENVFTVIEDTSPDTKKNLNADQLKAILRREETEINIKYAPVQKAKMNAFVWANGNCNFPFSTRGFTTIETNSITTEELSKISNSVLENALEADLLILQRIKALSNFLIHFLAKVSKIKSNNITQIGTDFKLELEKDRLQEVENLLRMLQTYKDSAIDFSNCCLNDFLSLEDTNREEKEKKAFFYTKTLKYLFTKSLVKVNTRGQELYSKWDMTKLMDINVDDFQVSCAGLDPLKEIDETFAKWDEIIKFAEDFENDPNNKFLKGSNEKLDDSWTICGKYDKEGEYNTNGDQVCVNKPLEGEVKNRTNTRVHQQNFLFECDDIPVKQQVEQIENEPPELKDSLLWTCFTGGKSIHAIVHTNLKDEDMWTEKGEYDTGLRKYIHQKLSEKYFGGHADASGQNASRLARAPNAIRQDEKHPGAKQLCLQFNMDAKPLDVSDLVEDYKEEKRLSRTLKELIGRPPIPEECRKEPSVHTLEDLEKWNMKAPSKAKQECIQFLKGTLEDWNRSIACVRELRNFGFSDCEIESEGPYNDKWIKAALKAAN